MKSSLFSSVSAGSPLPLTDYEEPFDVESYLLQHRQSSFYLQVAGDSMIGLGIHDGDILVVDKSVEPHSGSVVVAQTQDGFTVKQYELGAGRLRLVPANPAYSPVEPSEGCNLCGVATFVIHRL